MQHLAHRWQVNVCLIIIASCRILWCIIPCRGTYDSPWFGALVCGDWSMVDFDLTRLQRGNIALQLQLQLQLRHTSLHSMCHIIGFARVELSLGRTLVAHREGAFVRVIQCRCSCTRNECLCLFLCLWLSCELVRADYTPIFPARLRFVCIHCSHRQRSECRRECWFFLFISSSEKGTLPSPSPLVPSNSSLKLAIIIRLRTAFAHCGLPMQFVLRLGLVSPHKTPHTNISCQLEAQTIFNWNLNEAHAQHKTNSPNKSLNRNLIKSIPKKSNFMQRVLLPFIGGEAIIIKLNDIYTQNYKMVAIGKMWLDFKWNHVLLIYHSSNLT